MRTTRKLSSYSLQYDCERCQEALILGFGADGHPKVFRHAIGRDRPHDDPMLEQTVENFRALADFHADEIGMRRNPGKPEPEESIGELLHAQFVEQVALLHEFVVEQRR